MSKTNPPTTAETPSRVARQPQQQAKKPAFPPAFVILIRHRERGTIHTVMKPSEGPGVVAAFEDVEQAMNQANTMPACQNNPYMIVPFEE